MKRLIPAVFFQKQLNGEKQLQGEAAVKKPLVLDLYESEMRKIVGGRSAGLSSSMIARGPVGNLPYNGEVTTYSGSEGWLDVAQADDCGM